MIVTAPVREDIEHPQINEVHHPVETPPLDTRAMECALESRIGQAHWAQWFDGKIRWRRDNTAVYLGVANGFIAKWIRQKFIQDITAVTDHILGCGTPVEIEIRSDLSATQHLPAGTLPAVLKATGAAPAVLPTAAGTALNPRFVLEDFIPGTGNQLAYHAACSAAEEPERKFNPLFIHGHCGLGKTHLLQGICHRFARLYPAKRWLYMTGEQFTNEFLEAIKHNRMEQFRRRLRQADLLALDDIHFLARKLRTQEEFLHTFIQVDSHSRQIILASDCPPREIESMIESLTSRFVSGMVIRVDAPDMATRLAILRKMAVRRKWNLPDATLVRLAQEPVATVRDLEGLAHRMIARNEWPRSSSSGPDSGTAPASDQIVREICDRYKPVAPVSSDTIVRAVAEYFNLTPQDILGQDRRRLMTQARGIAMQLARQHSGMSFPDIGRAMGKRNHSTVIGACRRIEAQMAAGEVIDWQTAAGMRRESVSDTMRHLGSQIHRPV